MSWRQHNKEGIKAYYTETSGCVRVEDVFSESFAIGVGVLFSISMDNRELKAKADNADARLKLNGVGWSEVTCVFVDDNVLLVESAKEL